MVKVLRILLVIGIILSFSSFVPQNTGTITVNIKGLRNNKGQFMISLSRGSEGWPNENYYKQLFIEEFTSPDFTLEFSNIPYGNYAIGVLHDEDKNSKMTSNFIGMPKEGFGFSRDYQVSLRAPKYEESNFDFNQRNLSLEVNMQY